MSGRVSERNKQNYSTYIDINAGIFGFLCLASEPCTYGKLLFQTHPVLVIKMHGEIRYIPT
jgi:hypothetical protein